MIKGKTAHKQNGFLNCLRIQIVPEHYEEQRIQSIITFCKENAFDNVMLFINSEEYNTGHMTKEEAKTWIQTMKRAKEALSKEGISVSLNPWMEIGHLDRGRHLKEGQEFVTQCDFEGTKSSIVACPMDEKWLKYFLDFYAYLIKEIEPEVVWIEDDFCLHNHGNMKFGGCFCEHHIKGFNKKLGTNYTREKFVQKLLGPEPDDAAKKAMLEVNRECMVRLAERIGQMIRKLNLGTKVGLMSSMHQMHSMEYRDWNGIHQGLAQDGPLINRLHLPMYAEEASMKKYYSDFNNITFVCRGYLPEECHVLPELENGYFHTYAKDSECLRFQVESAIPAEIEGMTYDIFDFAGNGAVDVFGYGEVVKDITDYLTAVMRSSYSYHHLCGVTILLDETNSYNKKIQNDIYDMYPDEFYFGTLLQAQGISARCSKKKEFKNEVVILAAGSVNNLTDSQLRHMFDNNQVIIEGKAAVLLIDRGLGELIGAKGYKRYIANQDIQSYEEIEGNDLVNGIPGYRASAFAKIGNYISLIYDKQPEIKSRVYDYLGNELGFGIVIADSHLIVPYEITDFYFDLLHPLRQKLVCDYIDNLKKPFARADYANIYAYYSKGEENVLILVNPTLNSLPVTRYKLTGEIVKRLYEIDRDGIRREKEFYVDSEGFVTVQEMFSTITTKTFIIELFEEG